MNTRQEARTDAVRRLRRYTERFERRYECTSEAMAQALQRREQRETAEIARWMVNYHALKELE